MTLQPLLPRLDATLYNLPPYSSFRGEAWSQFYEFRLAATLGRAARDVGCLL